MSNIKALSFSLSRAQSGRGIGLLELYMSVQLDLRHQCLSDVAKLAKCSVTTVRNWRDGKTVAPRINTLNAVAQVLGYSVEWVKYYD